MKNGIFVGILTLLLVSSVCLAGEGGTFKWNCAKTDYASLQSCREAAETKLLDAHCSLTSETAAFRPVSFAGSDRYWQGASRSPNCYPVKSSAECDAIKKRRIDAINGLAGITTQLTKISADIGEQKNVALFFWETVSICTIQSSGVVTGTSETTPPAGNAGH